LAAIDAPATVTIVRLAEHNGGLLHWFYEHELVPGTRLELTAAEPAAGQRTIRVDGRLREVSDTAAAGLYVRVD